MLGAIIGDIAGSRFEFHNRKTKDFEIFHRKCRFTDDTVMSLAVAAALMEARDGAGRFGEAAARRSGGAAGLGAGEAAGGGNWMDALPGLFVKHMQNLGRKYENAGYGRSFHDWLFDEDPKPYNSWGNGSAMRVSPCGEVARSLGEAASLARRSAEVTHNHPEGIKGAEAIATAIFLARNGRTKDEIRDHINRYYYPLDPENFTLDRIRPEYRFDVSCQGSVPQAIQAFLEAGSFEDTIRNAISIGGDSDTIGAMAGSIAESYYGLDETMARQALQYLPRDLQDIVSAWYAV